MYWRFDAKKFALHQLPPFMRKKGIYALIKCFLTGIDWVYSLFATQRETITHQLNHNGSTASLEDFLNDKFGLSKGIYISDYLTDNIYLHLEGEVPENIYVSYQNEKDALFLSSISPDSTSGGFLVKIPAKLNTSQNLAVLNSWINYYRPAGTVYKIELYG